MGKVAADGPEAHDHVVIMARPLADRYFAAEQEIADCAPHSEYGRSSCHGFPHSGWRQKSDVPAECLLSRWLQRGGLLGTRTTIPSWACRIIAFGTRIKFFTVAQVAVSQSA